MGDFYGRSIVKCPLCGEEIGRGEILGIGSAICAQCSEELEPQFKKDSVDRAVESVAASAPVLGMPNFDQEAKAVETQYTSDKVAIGIYEDESKSKKKPKKKKTTKKSVSKALKGLKSWSNRT